MLSGVHEGLETPSEIIESANVRGRYWFYHYNIDGVDDRGWGCGYRTLQTICSWVCHALRDKKDLLQVPSLQKIQQTLVEIGDKPAPFAGSRDWIGSVEACLCLDQIFGVGGDADAASKTLLGVCKAKSGFYFLIADPHFYGKADKTLLQSNGWVQWKHLDDVFKKESFYNFCLPQLRNNTIVCSFLVSGPVISTL
ncbi:ufm1-specific protease 1-like isoform X2 [Montipora capricornis]|uniref:ufm1-specific protease 1-like isoform X2 n=1 Tax=Montipora capricornis TaxID=246305 RepID=UPI0035F13A06